MKLKSISIRNFRRLEHVTIDLEEKETIFVGPNNSGKTSATAIFRCFLSGRGFKVHDFSVSKISSFEKFMQTGEVYELPEISLDLWFEIDPSTIAFGRVFSLLPKLSDFTRVGIRLSFAIGDAKKLREEYSNAYPSNEAGERTRTLLQYLAIDANLSRHSVIRYASLEEVKNEYGELEVKLTGLEAEEGKRLVKNLIRVEFVDAQRNINDDDSSRSNKLSSAFASYYKNNLDKTDHAAEAHKVIDENNARLTDHYKDQFSPLFKVIKGLGVPSVNDRQLKIISSLSPETALRGNTELLYVDPVRQHELPELYNGLGFKNLIYMAIQARHFQSQWISTAENRPLCLLIFIEEPEVHLHAQVQQTFVCNIWNVINEVTGSHGEQELKPQLVVTTHSSHTLDAVEFEKVRYFRRSYLGDEEALGGIRNASEVHSLRSFRPDADVIDGSAISPDGALTFLKRYLRLTHCDLFFADAAILVEGAAEKLLLPSMIDASAKRLRECYISILEVGGAYAHVFEELLSFLKIPYLIITDIDSVAPSGNLSACRADVDGARTSNASLKKLLNVKTVAELVGMDARDKIDIQKDRCIAFEYGVLVSYKTDHLVMIPRTLEEAIAYENFAMLRDGEISIGVVIPEELPGAYEVIYSRVASKEFKKTDFAMSLLATTGWKVPVYIAEGLQWLESRLLADIPVDTASSSTVRSAVGVIA